MSKWPELLASAPADRLAVLIAVIALILAAGCIRALWRRLLEREREIEELHRLQQECIRSLAEYLARMQR